MAIGETSNVICLILILQICHEEELPPNRKQAAQDLIPYPVIGRKFTIDADNPFFLARKASPAVIVERRRLYCKSLLDMQP